MPRPYPASLRERVLADLALGDLEVFPKQSNKNPNSVAAVARRYDISEGTVRRWQRAERDEAAKHYGRFVAKKEKRPRGRPTKYHRRSCNRYYRLWKVPVQNGSLSRSDSSESTPVVPWEKHWHLRMCRACFVVPATPPNVPKRGHFNEYDPRTSRR
jgi:transposase-like protein